MVISVTGIAKQERTQPSESAVSPETLPSRTCTLHFPQCWRPPQGAESMKPERAQANKIVSPATAYTIPAGFSGSEVFCKNILTDILVPQCYSLKRIMEKYVTVFMPLL
jgi:hypothetical protein